MTSPKQSDEYSDFIHVMEAEYRSLVSDIAFVEEFLAHNANRGEGEISPAQIAFFDVFWTMRDSLILGIMRLADTKGDCISLPRAKNKFGRLARIYSRQSQNEDRVAAFKDWSDDVKKWQAGAVLDVLGALRNEVLAHNVKTADIRKKKPERLPEVIKIAERQYPVKIWEILDFGYLTIQLLARLITLCGKGRNRPQYRPSKCAPIVGYEAAALGDVTRDVTKSRENHRALVSKVFEE